METEGFHFSNPAIPLDTPGTILYTINVGGVTNTGKDILSTPTNGDIRLVDASTAGEGTAQWRFTYTTNNGAHLSDTKIVWELCSTEASKCTLMILWKREKVLA